MIPRRHAFVLAGALTGTFMSVIMSALVSAVNTGLGPGHLARWAPALAVAWTLAVPRAIVAARNLPGLVLRTTLD